MTVVQRIVNKVRNIRIIIQEPKALHLSHPILVGHRELVVGALPHECVVNALLDCWPGLSTYRELAGQFQRARFAVPSEAQGQILVASTGFGYAVRPNGITGTYFVDNLRFVSDATARMNLRCWSRCHLS